MNDIIKQKMKKNKNIDGLYFFLLLYLFYLNYNFFNEKK